MSKRARKGGEGSVDLDDELSRKTPRPRGAVLRRDNWKVSAEKAGGDSKRNLEWNEKKKSLGLGATNVHGYWDYSRRRNERVWITHDAEPGSEKTPGCPFPAHEGDHEISKIYRDFWVGGDAKSFIHVIYRYEPRTLRCDVLTQNCRRYAVEGVVEEEDIWKIWRCLVGELVPSVCSLTITISR